MPSTRKITFCATMNGLLSIGDYPFYRKFTKGFQTFLSENGAALSGGQWQRIAIARALYRDPEILILDEITSSLDATSEQYVQRMISMLKHANKTVIVITHRLSTILNADRVIVLEKGLVVEDGKHAEWIEFKGAYYNLWAQQMPVDFDRLSDKDALISN